MSAHLKTAPFVRLRRQLLSRALRLESLETRLLMAGDVTGTIYADDNRDGLRSNGENAIPGWTVFLDLNKDGALNTGEPATVTNKDGDYTLRAPAAGNVRVAEVVAAGWIATSPAVRDVIAPTSGNVKADFFAFSGGEIAGSVWNDLNQDGIRDSGDAGLSGWTVYLDLNQSLTLDDGEPKTVTDSNGDYLFTELPPDDYEVTEVLPTGWEISDPYDWKQTVGVTRRERATQDFANFSITNGSIQGLAFNDLNANGVRDVDAAGGFVEAGLEGWTIFLDTNNNRVLDGGELSAVTDASGEYLFLSLAAGDYEVTEQLPDGWDVSPGSDSRQTVAVNGGEVSNAGDFANFTVLNGAVSGTMWNDLNRNGLRDFDSISGVTIDPPLVGWSVFLDLNRNAAYDAGEPQFTTDANGNYEFLDLQVGDYEVREIVLSGWEATVGFSDNYTVHVVSGVTTTTHDFANFDATGSGVASITGSIWNDLNSNGVFETSESGLADWTVFLDNNSDGLLTAGEPQTTTSATGDYTFQNLPSGTVTVVVSGVAGWRPTAPATNVRTITVRGGVDISDLNFGQSELLDSSISGSVYIDKDSSGTRTVGDRGLPGIIVFLDTNENGLLDSGEPQTTTSTDMFYTPGFDEAGEYSFTHLSNGRFVVRTIVPETLSATPSAEQSHIVTIASAENRTAVDTKAVYRPNEIHGVKYVDVNGNHVRDTGEPGVSGVTIFVDTNRNQVLDAGEPSAVTDSDGSYGFSGLAAGAYVLREVTDAGYTQTAPDTVGGILWPAGTSHAAMGNVTPGEITRSLKQGESYRTSVSLTLPTGSALTNLVDVFLLFDDTGSFTNNSPIVRAAFPDIITRLQSSLPGIDLGFGVGRMEEYANFAYEYSTGRPFVLNQPIVAASNGGTMAAIQAALNRTAPGYGGDQPETDIEALYQLVTGKGFDGNNNGSVLDSGVAGLAATQTSPGDSGDVPSFASFQADPANSVLPAAGNVGGAGFRSGSLPIVLLATDTGFAYQPKGETTVTGAGGVALPLTQLTETSRATTPYNSGAGIQETVTALNALGALVIGLGTNTEFNLDPRQQLEALSTLTGAMNHSTSTIDNGTTDPIAPGDPLYFQIASGFSTSVANGVVNAIQNAVRNVAVDIDIVASDPRVHIINHSGVVRNVGSGQTATFDIEFVGDGAPHRFDLQFVRAGTNVVLGSIPVVLGTPIPGDHYEFDELDDGEIEIDDGFGSQKNSVEAINQSPAFTAGANVSLTEDAGGQSIANWATNISPGPTSEIGQRIDFQVSVENTALFAVAPIITSSGTLSFTPADNAFGNALVTVLLHDDGGTVGGGVDTSAPQQFTIVITAVNDVPEVTDDAYTFSEDSVLTVSSSRLTVGILQNDTDVDSPVLSALLIAPPAHGTLNLHADGTFVFTPESNFSGQDYFTYKVSDGSAQSATGTVTFTILPENDAPLALNENYAATSGVTLVIAAPGVLANDSDVDSSMLTSTLVTGPAHGSVTLQANGAFSYTSAVGYSGLDSFTYVANDGSAESSPATVSIQVQALAGAAKFYVVDGASRSKFGYDANGVLTGENKLNKEDSGSRGIAISKDGSTTWIIDKDAVVFVYNSTGGLIGSWKAEGIDKPEGIASDDKNIWIVDRETDKVFLFAGAAMRKSGTIKATSSFSLNSKNLNAMDIASDGTHLWIVNDAGADQIFRYSTKGVLEGSWKLDARNTSPTGLTIDPNHIDHIWVVDSGSDAVYQYDSATNRLDGIQNASKVFVLAAGNTYPQGIADPLAAPTWTNQSMAWDVNNDGVVTPLDVLEVINRLNTSSDSTLPDREISQPYWDVNSDGYVSSIDALDIINCINARSSQAISSHDAVLAGWYDDRDDKDDIEEPWQVLSHQLF